MGKDTKEIEETLNRDFSYLYERFVHNTVIIHFGEGKTKSINF